MITIHYNKKKYKVYQDLRGEHFIKLKGQKKYINLKEINKVSVGKKTILGRKKPKMKGGGASISSAIKTPEIKIAIVCHGIIRELREGESLIEQLLENECLIIQTISGYYSIFIEEGRTERLEVNRFFEHDWFLKIGEGKYIITQQGLNNQQEFREAFGTINHREGTMTRFVAHNTIITPTVLQFTRDWNNSKFPSGVYCQVGNQPIKKYFPTRDSDGLSLVENGSSTKFLCELPELLKCIRSQLKTEGKETHIFGTFCQSYNSDVNTNMKQQLRKRDRETLNQQRRLTGLPMKKTRSLHYNNSYYNVTHYFSQSWDDLPVKDKPLIERQLKTFQNNTITNTSNLWETHKKTPVFQLEVIKTNPYLRLTPEIALTMTQNELYEYGKYMYLFNNSIGPTRDCIFYITSILIKESKMFDTTEAIHIQIKEAFDLDLPFVIIEQLRNQLIELYINFKYSEGIDKHTAIEEIISSLTEKSKMFDTTEAIHTQIKEAFDLDLPFVIIEQLRNQLIELYINFKYKKHSDKLTSKTIHNKIIKKLIKVNFKLSKLSKEQVDQLDISEIKKLKIYTHGLGIDWSDEIIELNNFAESYIILIVIREIDMFDTTEEIYKKLYDAFLLELPSVIIEHLRRELIELYVNFKYGNGSFNLSIDKIMTLIKDEFRLSKEQVSQMSNCNIQELINFKDAQRLRWLSELIKKLLQHDHRYQALIKSTTSSRKNTTSSRTKLTGANVTGANINQIPVSGGKKKMKKVAKKKPTKKKLAKKKLSKKVRKIHKGPRGGKYYITKGRKVYI